MADPLHFEETFEHSSVLIGKDVFVWGGQQLLSPSVHDSAKKRQFTSLVQKIDILTSRLYEITTTGSRPNGTTGYKCCSIGHEIYYFGGECKCDDCYHNDLFILDTNTNKWKEVLSSGNRPMKKAFCGMISFRSDGEDYLLVVGGIGPIPASTPANSEYLFYPILKDPSLCWTNEVHLMCVSSFPGKWAVPVKKGNYFPPSAGFTMDPLPGNKAILFGGGTIGEEGLRHRTNTVFIISFTNSCVEFQTLVEPSDPDTQWPKGRSFHSSAVINSTSSDGLKRPHLIVIGGNDDDEDVVPDCWIMDIENKTWKEISLPESVTRRSGFSMNSFTMSSNSFWLILTGGFAKGSGLLGFFLSFVTPIFNPNAVMMVELVFSPADDKWSVSKVMNSEDMMKDQYSKALFNQISEGRSDNHLEEELMIGTTALEQTDDVKKDGDGKHKSDQIVPNIWIEECQELLAEKEKELCHFKELEKVQKKKALALHKEIEDLRFQIKSAEKGVQEDDLEIEHPLVTMEGSDIKEDISNTVKPQMVDVGVQFNYVSLETDNLQDLTFSGSRLFTLHGDHPQSFVWEGFGFELHFPPSACLPGEECDINVDAVVGGEFVFPEGVEPVSAIYIISIMSKLHKPSLLKIQHCVALDCSKHSHLCFYRAFLKESKPPYHFSCIVGGKFDINSQYGELELPTFCAMAIGKCSTNSETSSDTQSEGDANSSSSDTQSEGDTKPSSSSDINELEPEHIDEKDCDGLQSVEKDQLDFIEVDSSVLYSGEVFYLEKRLNEWQMKFIVVKNLDAFARYVESKLSQHESDVSVSMRFSASYVELVLGKCDVKGWSIEPHSEPCSIPLKLSSSFGYKKDVSIPPTCLVTIYGNNKVPDYVKRLHYPVPLSGALIGNSGQESKIFFKRTMAELVNPQMLSTAHVAISPITDSTLPPVDSSAVVTCIKERIDSNFAPLKNVFDTSIETVTAEMFTVGLISSEVKNKPSTDKIISNFYAGFAFMKTLPQILQHCKKFFSVFYKIGGPFTMAGDSLKQEILQTLKEKFNIDLSFD